MWQTGNRIARSPTLGRETKLGIFCEWNTKFSIIPEIPSKRVHSKRIPKFPKILPGIFTVPFNFGPEISEFLVEWKAPIISNIGSENLMALNQDHTFMIISVGSNSQCRLSFCRSFSKMLLTVANLQTNKTGRL